ncbi:MAG: nitric oxide reductase activation protein NorD, partial [Candidatus Binatia bacterium]
MSVNVETIDQLAPIIPHIHHDDLIRALGSVEATTIESWLHSGLLQEWITQGAQSFPTAETGRPFPFSQVLAAIPTFLPYFTYSEILEWMKAVREIAEQETGVFAVLPDGFTLLETNDRIAFYRLVRTAAYRSPDAAVALYRTGPRHLLAIPEHLRPVLMRCLHTAATFDPAPLPSLLPLLGPIVRALPTESQRSLVERIGKVAQTFPAGVARLFRTLTRAYDEVGEEGVLAWMTAGEDIAERNAQAGEAFFALDSRTSLLLLRGQSLEVTLEHVAGVLLKYLHMISGMAVGLEETDALTFPLPLAPASGEVLTLPQMIDLFSSYEENVRLYRVLAAQHAGRLAFGTYGGSLSQAWAMLPGEARHLLKGDEREDGDIMAYFERFPHAQQLELLFVFLENRRISQRLATVYRGLRADLAWAESLTHLWSPAMANVIRSIPQHQIPQFGPESTVYDSLRIATELHVLLLGRWQESWESSPITGDMQGGAARPPADMTRTRKEDGAGRQALSAEDHAALERLLAFLRKLEQSKANREAHTTSSAGLIGTVITANENSEEAGEDAEEADRQRARNKGVSYRYDEWDYLIDDYRTQWCHVREIPIVGDDGAFFSRTLATYTEVAPEIKREFQRLRPRLYRQVSGLEDGEDIDLNACIAARVDYLTGVPPSPKIYTARQPLERDVAALFLLDMSASTDTPLEGKDGIRTIDLMKEALVLLSSALDDIGDSYAVYGFSSYGRRNVEMYPVKQFTETLSAGVRGRIGGLQPRRSTRMGTAIRHASRRLREVSCRAKFLVLISDGYPEDADYGPSKHAPTYGVRDTMMALRETERAGILPFCLTVDKAGHDYLREMCAPSRYMVLDDVTS